MLRRTQDIVAATVKELFDLEITPHVSIPEEQFGDVATNVAMQLAKSTERNPRDLAEQIQQKLVDHADFAEVTVAGPGFINFRLHDEVLLAGLGNELPQVFADQTVVAEYSDPNLFKVLHVGHLYTSVIGSAISNLLEASGASVHRVNFGGDVGLHVAKAMWGIVQALGGEHPEKLASVPKNQRSAWLSDRYVEGNTAYESEDGEAAKKQIIAFNKRVYQLFADDDTESPFAEIYHTCRQWSYDYFNAFYDRIGTPFEKYYPESQTAPTGLQLVRRELENGVYEVSDGAVIFDGEAYGLHRRVFVNSDGLPTYEAKDVGLAMQKWQDYQFDRSVIITGSDILQYMQVVMKSIEQYEPKLVERTTHVTHGMVKLKDGAKMSSRAGNIVKATDILDAVLVALPKDDESTMLAAVKYSFLKQSIGQDVLFEVDDSVATRGNSGPYLQYAHARACSILSKVSDLVQTDSLSSLDSEERRLARKLGHFEDAFLRSLNELAPHHLCTYLYELSQTFNLFYENTQVVGDQRQGIRIRLVSTYADVLRRGLGILGIEAPEKV